MKGLDRASSGEKGNDGVRREQAREREYEAAQRASERASESCVANWGDKVELSATLVPMPNQATFGIE